MAVLLAKLQLHPACSSSVVSTPVVVQHARN